MHAFPHRPSSTQTWQSPLVRHVAAEQQERAAISIWSSTSGAVTLPACQEVCGELGLRSVGTTSLESCWAEEGSRWPIWWLAGIKQRLFCSRVRACICVWHQQTGRRGVRRPPVSWLIVSFMCGQRHRTGRALLVFPFLITSSSLHQMYWTHWIY